MEYKITNLTLRYLILELKPLLEGAFLNRVQEVDREIYKFKIRTREGSKDLIIRPSALYLTQYKIPAKQNAYGFGAFLNKHLKNKKIMGVEQHGSDRIAILEFSDYFLIAEFLSDFNIVLCNHEMEILQPLHRKAYRDRTLKKGIPYQFPPVRGLNPAKITSQELKKIFEVSELDAVRTLIKNINIAPIFAEEVLFLAKIDKHTPTKKLSSAGIAKLHACIQGAYKGKADANKKPVLFQTMLLPFGLQSVSAKETDAGNLNTAADGIFSKEFLLRSRKDEGEKTSKEKAKTEYYLNEQIMAKEHMRQKIEKGKIAAELIYANFPELQELIAAIKSAERRKLPKKQIMYKLKSAGDKGSRAAKLLVEYDPKHKEIVVEL